MNSNRINKNRKNNRKGLTLIELLVTVLILGILAAVAIPLYTSSISDARNKTAEQNRQTVLHAVQVQAAKASQSYATIKTNLATSMVTALPDLGTTVAPPSGCGTAYTYTATASSFTIADTCGSSVLGA